jgi:hypothetical protein
MAKKMTTRSLFSEVLWGDGFTGGGPVYLVEEISRQHSIQAVA